MSVAPEALVPTPRHPPRWDDVPPPPLDESTVASVDDLPLSTRFRLGPDITPLQRAFLDRHGFLVFDRVASRAEVELILAELDRAEAEVLASRQHAVYGIPVWVGLDPDGKDYLFRLGFSSTFSPALSEFVRHVRFEPIRKLIGDDARIGEKEKDGVVFNRYVRAEGSLRPDLAWHTDALRDVGYNWKMPGPMLNVGLHFDRIRPEDGGLRLLPGTHTQSVWSTLFRKIHFVTSRPDPAELPVETWPGDLTVHDGRMWHRVAGSPKTGWESLRRSMYVPYVCDRYKPKDENSPTPVYLRLFDAVMRARKRRIERRR